MVTDNKKHQCWKTPDFFFYRVVVGKCRSTIVQVGCDGAKVLVKYITSMS